MSTREVADYQQGFHDGYMAALQGRSLDLPVVDAQAEMRAFERGDFGAHLDPFTPAYRQGFTAGIERAQARRKKP